MEQVSLVSDNSLAVSASSFSYFQAQAANVSISTKEGDAVTVSLLSERSLQYLNYSAEGTVEGQETSISGSALSYSASEASVISVQGDLNNRELHDIDKSLQTIDKAYRDLEKGHTFQAAKRIANLDKYESIARLDANVSEIEIIG
jgi:hypothetical protein